MNLLIPPIKCQGIKTKLVKKINILSKDIIYDRWVEPFMGSGVVAFNIRPHRALLCDSNPHLISFYQAIKDGVINSNAARAFLYREGKMLLEKGENYYYFVRDRFNDTHDSFDFIFLNRSCFNGVMRFNSKGHYNVPFCRKEHRFSPAYITKICNQIESVSKIISLRDYQFICQDFRMTFKMITEKDFLYCDPPYIDRHTDYFNKWTEEDEDILFDNLSNLRGRFIFSTWNENQFRKNKFIERYKSKFHLITQEHFYHVGGGIENRHSISEAFLLNFLPCPEIKNTNFLEQPVLAL